MAVNKFAGVLTVINSSKRQSQRAMPSGCRPTQRCRSKFKPTPPLMVAAVMSRSGGSPAAASNTTETKPTATASWAAKNLPAGRAHHGPLM